MVIADSPWVGDRPHFDRMAGLPLGPRAIPALRFEPALVDALADARLEDANLAEAAARFAPAPLIITSADDHNGAAAPADHACIFAAAAQPKQCALAFTVEYVGLPANAVTAGA